MNDQSSGRTISAYGMGEASVAPNLATVIFVVSANGKEPAALREEISGRASAVLASLRDLGIAESDLNAPGLTIQPEYDYRDGQRLIGYRAARALDARVRDLDRLGEVLDAIVAGGANEVGGAYDRRRPCPDGACRPGCSGGCCARQGGRARRGGE